MWIIDWFKSHPWTMGIGTAIFLLAIVGVVIGIITKGRWKDKGFMRTDDDEHPLRWAPTSLPLTLIFHSDLSLVWRAAIRGAARRFELAIGRALFEDGFEAPPEYNWNRPPSITTPVVAISSSEPAGELQIDHAVTRHRYDKQNGTILAAEVVFPKEIHDAHISKMDVAMHELGHILGLDHDESTTSIMYYKLSERVEPGELSDDDKERLKKTYL